MITETGKNLSVLISTEVGKDWETFATWYSVHKNLPDAKIVIACQRNDQVLFQLYQWAQRLRVPLFYYNPGTTALEEAKRRDLVKDNMLMMFPLTLVTHSFDKKTLELLNAQREPVFVEAKESDELCCLVSYKKGCGKWLDTLKGCPFSSAAGLATIAMTANENRIIELWKKMCSLYKALI